MSGRPFARADYLALKAAVRRACEAGGPLHALAAHTRVDPALLSRYGNPNEQTFVPVDVAMDLDRLAGEPLILRAWAERCGFELVPREVMPQPVELADHIADVARGMSGVIGELAEVTRDNVTTPAEAARVDAAAADAIDELNELRDDCRRVQAGDSGRVVVKIGGKGGR